MRRASMVLAYASLVTIGCAAPLTGPAAGGAPWTEVRSAHFNLRTDLELGEARAVLGSVEQVYDVFKRVAFPSEADPHDRIDVTVFARAADYKAIAPPTANAYFTTALPHDLEPSPTVVMHGGLDDDKRRVLQHELTHFFVHQAFGGVPAWFNEGLAEYYSTVTVHEGHAYVGLARPDRHVNLVRAAPWKGGRDNEVWVPIQALPTPARLLSMNQETFYARGSEGPDAARLRTTRYLGAWGLVHLLHEGPADYRQRYAALVDQLHHGKPFGLAFGAAFHDLDGRALAGAYAQHLAATARWHAVPYTPGPAPPPAEPRPMGDAEVHLLWARMMGWSGDEKERAARQLDEAAASEPGAFEVRFWRAEFAASARHSYADAVRGFDELLATRPDDARLLHALARTLSWWESAGQAPPGRFAQAVAALEKQATTPTQLDFVARDHLRRGRLAQAAPLAERAARADPTCASCYDTWAQVAFQKGDVAEALAAEERAIAMHNERRVDPAMLARLKRYAEAYAASVKGVGP
jgi:tetratricopeptide (TPR) repeat protein